MALWLRQREPRNRFNYNPIFLITLEVIKTVVQLFRQLLERYIVLIT